MKKDEAKDGSEEEECIQECGVCDTINLCLAPVVNHVVCLPIAGLSEEDRRMVSCQRPDVQRIYAGRMAAVGVLRENNIPLILNDDCASCTVCFTEMQKLSTVFCKKIGHDVARQVAWAKFLLKKSPICRDECVYGCAAEI